jgi:hypothetical protein
MHNSNVKGNEVDHVQKDGDVQFTSQTFKQVINPVSSADHPLLFHIQDFAETVFVFTRSYLFHPLLAFETFLPRFTPNMWPFGSSVAFKPATDIKPLNGKVIL